VLPSKRVVLAEALAGTGESAKIENASVPP
jgi:hypothetical protein